MSDKTPETSADSRPTTAIQAILTAIVDATMLEGHPAKQTIQAQIDDLVSEAKTDVKKDLRGLLANVESNG